MKRRLGMVLGLAGTALFLWLAARNVDFARLREVLAGARLAWLVPMLGIGLLDIVIRAARWRILLSQAVDASFWALFRLSAIGLAVNNVLFARLGELTRAVLAARSVGVPVATSLASVAVERALDVAALLTLFLLAGWSSPLVAPAFLRGAGLILAAAIGALAFLAAAEKTLLPGGAVERLLRKWPKLHTLVEQLALGAAVLRKPAAVVPVVLLSLGLWIVDAGVYWCAARALNLGALMDYPSSVLVLSWAGAGAALPAAPGAIGTFEAMVKDILVKLGATPHQGFGYALFTHMVMYIFVTVLGLAFLYRVGLSLSGLKESLEAPK